MADKPKVQTIRTRCFKIFEGYLLFAEDDLQHAAYWCKDKSIEERAIILSKFQEVWKYA